MGKTLRTEPPSPTALPGERTSLDGAGGRQVPWGKSANYIPVG